MYNAKHRAVTPVSKVRRTFMAAVVGGATIVGGMAVGAPQAQAAGGGVWDRVAACESGGNWKISTGNGYHGGLQFSRSSWRAAGGSRYASMPHHATKAQQIAVAKKLLRMQGPGAWPVCSRKAGLTRSNGASGGGSAVAASRSTQRVTSSKGVLSRAEVRKLQRKVGARVDGIVGPETVRKTERRLGIRLSGKRYLSGAALTGAHRLAR